MHGLAQNSSAPGAYSLCNTWLGQMRVLRDLRQCLTLAIAGMAFNALVNRQLDYCNSSLNCNTSLEYTSY